MLDNEALSFVAAKLAEINNGLAVRGLNGRIKKVIMSRGGMLLLGAPPDMAITVMTPTGPVVICEIQGGRRD